MASFLGQKCYPFYVQNSVAPIYTSNEILIVYVVTFCSFSAKKGAGNAKATALEYISRKKQTVGAST